MGLGYALSGFWGLLGGSWPSRDPGSLLHLLGGGLAQGALLAILGATVGWARARQPGLLVHGAATVAGLVAAGGAHTAYLALVEAFRQGGPLQPLVAAGLLAFEWSGVGLLAAGRVWSARRQRELLRWCLWEEVAAGVVREEEYHALAADGRGMPGPVRSALVRLAFAKRRVVRGVGRAEEVEVWRKRVMELRRGR